MIIKVTQRHINLGRAHTVSNTKCPIARALRSAGFKTARVGVDWVNTRSKGPKIILPKRVRNFISEKLIFGIGTMAPFEFKLTAAQVRVLRGKR